MDIFSIPKMSVNASPQFLHYTSSFTHLTLKGLIWVIVNRKFYQALNPPNIQLFWETSPTKKPFWFTSIDYITGIAFIYLSNHFSPQNTDESSPTPRWDITTHRPHFGARGQSCLPNLREKQVSLLHDQIFWEGLLPIGSMRLAFTYLHGWLIFCGFHASKYTIQGSYVIYLPTIHINLSTSMQTSICFRANGKCSIEPVSLGWHFGGSTSSLAPNSSHFWGWLGKKSMTTTVLK